MKNKRLAITVMLVSFGLATSASASETDCFPMCKPPVTPEAVLPVKATLETIEIVANAREHTDTPALASLSCQPGVWRQAENLNNTLKPIREMVGYVRSPQGLAIKLVHDHVVKIPAWVGYVMDPIGAIKRRAIDEVRFLAKDALNDDAMCDANTTNEVPIPHINIYDGHSV